MTKNVTKTKLDAKMHMKYKLKASKSELMFTFNSIIWCIFPQVGWIQSFSSFSSCYLISADETSSPNKPSELCRTDGRRRRKSILIWLLHMGPGPLCVACRVYLWPCVCVCVCVSVKVVSEQTISEWLEAKETLRHRHRWSDRRTKMSLNGK